MKVTLDLKKNKYKQYKDMREGETFVNAYTCQAMIYKGIVEEAGQKLYSFITLDNEGCGDMKYDVNTYSCEKLQVVDLSIIIRS